MMAEYKTALQGLTTLKVYRANSSGNFYEIGTVYFEGGWAKITVMSVVSLEDLGKVHEYATEFEENLKDVYNVLKARWETVSE